MVNVDRCRRLLKSIRDGEHKAIRGAAGLILRDMEGLLHYAPPRDGDIHKRARLILDELGRADAEIDALLVEIGDKEVTYGDDNTDATR